MKQARNLFVVILLIIYYWLVGIVMFFVPKSLRKKSVKDELVLITGGGSGLGRCLAILFAKQGTHIVLWDINESGLEESVRMIKETNPSIKCKSYVCDITDRQKVYETADKVRQEIGSVTILVNNAGVVSGKSFMDIPDDKIVQTFNVNVISHYWTVKAFLPDMIKKKSGHLVSVASMAGLMGSCQLSDYCATKFACIGFEESLRLELQRDDIKGIKSTIALPYFMNTGMFAGVESPIMPALEPDYVAKEIMSAILTDAEHVVIPKLGYFFTFLKTILPVQSFYKLYELMGGFVALNNFTGRQTDNNNVNNNVNNNTNSRKIK